jgi:hypothetical protein
VTRLLISVDPSSPADVPGGAGPRAQERSWRARAGGAANAQRTEVQPPVGILMLSLTRVFVPVC